MKTVNRSKKIFFLMIGSLAMLAPMPAFALLCGLEVGTIVVSATPVNFGVYDPSSASATDANGSVSIECGILGVDVLPSFAVSLSVGQAVSYAPRKMLSGPSSLSYNLYTTASHTIVWGDGTGGTSTNAFDGLLSLLASTSMTVYGRVPAGQYVTSGSYTDTIIVTVTY